MIASTFFDLVIGVDMHFEMVPTPAPVPTPFPHPFMGMVLDPGGLITGLIISNAIGMIAGAPPTGPVLVNLMPATNTGTDVKNSLVLPHFVIPPGTMWAPMPKAPKPKIGAHAAPAPDLPVAPAGDAVLMMGSKTVAIMGSNAVRLGDLAMSCSEPVRLPSSAVLAIPKGMPVLMGGPPAIDWQQAIGALLRSQWVAGRLHALVSRIRNQRLRNLLHRGVCFLTGHPVDVATGRVMTWTTDFELPGPLPLKLERSYASSWADRDSVVGHGWSHSLDQAVWLERGKVVYRAEDGREIEFDTFDFPDHVMRKGDSCYEPLNRITLRSLGQLRWELETADGITLDFAPVPGDSRKGYARLVAQRTRTGHSLQFAHDARGCLEEVTDSGGRRILFAHDAQGRLSRVSLPHPREQSWVTHTRYVYSAEGDLTEVHDALGHITRYAYEGHLLVKETDRTGLSFYFGYDGVGADAYCVRTWGDGGLHDHELLYDKKGHVTAVTDSLGHTTTYVANPVNAVVKVVDPLGGETQYAYDDTLRKTAEIDPLGNETRYEYDDRGNRTKVLLPDGAVFTFEYDTFHHRVRAVDAIGGEWRWRYDAQGRMVERTNPLGEAYRYDYRAGMPASIRSPSGNRIVLEYDEQGNLRRLLTPDQAEMRWEHDRLGRVTKLQDALGNVRSFEYDACHRLIREGEPGTSARELRYDAEGNLLEAREGPLRVAWGYAGFHWLASREEAGEVLRFQYDTEGLLEQVLHPSGAAYRYLRDARGGVIEEQAFDGRTLRYLRDPVGRLSQLIKPSGATQGFSYDPCGRLLQREFSGGGKERYRYRADGCLIEATNDAMAVLFECDALGRVVRETQGTQWISSQYDPDGERTALQTSLGTRTIISRSAMGDVQVLTSREGQKSWSVEFLRDPAGNELERRLPGGVRQQWAQDSQGRPTRRLILQGERLQERLEYRWDGKTRLVAQEDSLRGTTTYHSDAQNRLVSATEPDGQERLRSTFSMLDLLRESRRSEERDGTGGWLQPEEGLSLRLDADGRVIEWGSKEQGRWLYRYGDADMLMKVTRPDGGEVAFTYDALGRRVRKCSQAGETAWLWDGDVPLQEQGPSGSPITWVFEPESFTLLGRLQDSERHGVVSDQLGTPTALYDSQGELTWRMWLDIRGQSHEEPTGTACPWRWPGQYEDTETGLHYNRFRYYSPQLGHYLSPDPLGLLGGLELWSYVGNPLLWIDPLGLAACDRETRRTRPLTEDELNHAFDRHAAELFGRDVSRERDFDAFRQLVDRARRSGLTFPFQSGNSSTFGHFARLNGQSILVQFFADGPQAGNLATIFRPSQRQLRRIMGIMSRSGP